MITITEVKQIISMGGLAFPYPRLKQISINGSRGKPADQLAIQYAQAHLKTMKGTK